MCHVLLIHVCHRISSSNLHDSRHMQWKRPMYAVKETYIPTWTRRTNAMNEMCHRSSSSNLHDSRHMRVSRVRHMNGSCNTYEWGMSHMNVSCHTYEWVMSHIWMSHVTHINGSHRTYEWVMSHVWMSHVAHMNESCHTYEWVTSHIWMCHATHMDESCHTYEWVIIQDVVVESRRFLPLSNYLSLSVCLSLPLSHSLSFLWDAAPTHIYIPHIYMYMCTWIYVCTHTQTPTHALIHMDVWPYVIKCVPWLIHMCIWIFVCTHTQTLTHTQIHIWMCGLTLSIAPRSYVWHCNTLQHTATRCNTLQHTVP